MSSTDLCRHQNTRVKDMFVTTAGSEYVSMGGRDAEMTFGIGKIAYSNLYLHNYTTYATEAGCWIAKLFSIRHYANWLVRCFK